MWTSYFRLRFVVLVFAEIGLLAGCGGGGGGSGGASVIAPSLGGLAATGAGIANASVTAKCATGAPLTGTSDSNGSFNLVLAGQTLPCMLKVSGGTPTVTLYSFAVAAGRINITPVTDLIVSRALGSDPAAAFAAYSAAQGVTLESGLTVAKTYVASQINTMTGGAISDPMTGAFSVGDADDKVLDALGSAMSNAGKTIEHLRTDAQVGNALPVTPFLMAPGNLTATAGSSSGITLSWSSVPAATLYKIYRATSTGVATSGSALATSVTTTYSDTGLSASTVYYYKVVPANTAIIAGTASAEANATTGAASIGGTGLTCDTSKFAQGAAVAAPTAQDLATFARTYTGSEGAYGPNPGDAFVATGSATLVFSSNGSVTYNGANYVPSSYCVETLSGGGGTQLVIHSGVMSHFDLKATGVWSGYTSTGKVVTDAPYSGGTPSVWTTHSIPGSGSFEDVVWDGSKFVAMGSYVGTSTDGASWTFNALLAGKGLARSGSTLVLAGISTATGSDIRKSVNGGTSWTTPATANIFTVTGNTSMFVGIGGGAEAGNGQAMVVRTSGNGDTWTTRYTESVPNGQSKITSRKPVWSGSKWLISAVKYDPTISDFYGKYEFFVLTSTDGLSWTKTVLTNVKGNYIWPWWPVWTGSEFVLIDKSKTLKSSDGVNWSAPVTNNFTATTYDFVGWTGTEFVAFSGGGSSVLVWTSPDAIAWTSRATTATQPIYGGASNGSTYVAVGNQFTFSSP